MVLELANKKMTIHSKLLRENIYFSKEYIELIDSSYQPEKYCKRYTITEKGKKKLKEYQNQIQEEIRNLQDDNIVPRDTVKIKIEDYSKTDINKDPNYKQEEFCYWFTGTTDKIGRHFNVITQSKCNRKLSTFQYEYDVKGSNWAVFLSLSKNRELYPEISAYVSDTKRYRTIISEVTTLPINEIKTEITALGFGKKIQNIHFMIRDIELLKEMNKLGKEITQIEINARGSIRTFIDKKIKDREEITYKTRRWFLYEFYEDQIRRCLLDYAYVNTRGHYGQVHDCVYTEDIMVTEFIEKYISKITGLDIKIQEIAL